MLDTILTGLELFMHIMNVYIYTYFKQMSVSYIRKGTSFNLSVRYPKGLDFNDLN